MKTLNSKFAVILIITLAFVVHPAIADEHQESSTKIEKSESTQRSTVLQFPDEVYEGFLYKVARDDPQRAQQLKELKETDPEKFREQMKNEFQELSSKASERRSPRRGSGGGYGRRMGFSEEEKPFDSEDRSQHGEQREHRMRRFGGFGSAVDERVQEFIDWLESQYPQDAKKINNLKDNPDLFRKELGIAFDKYRRIFEASKDNPEYSQILIEDLELANQIRTVNEQIKDTTDQDRKTQLTKQLTDLLNQKYDLIVKRKEFAYKQLLKKLEDLKSRVEKSEEKIQQWKDPEFKKANVQQRLKQLLDESQKFDWNQ